MAGRMALVLPSLKLGKQLTVFAISTLNPPNVQADKQ
jgi:hypothetical protein